MPLTMPPIRIIGLGLLVLGLASGIASTSLDYWYYLIVFDEVYTVTAYFGVWEFCVKSEHDSSCTSWSFLDDQSGGTLNITWLKACQAVMVIGVVFNTIACVIALTQMPKKNAQRAACFGGILYLIAAVLFFSKYKDVVFIEPIDGNLHAGFGLAIAAGLINLISICVLAPVQAQTGEDYERV